MQIALQLRKESSKLNRLEPNPSMAGVLGCWLIPAANPPEAARQALQLVASLPGQGLSSEHLVEVIDLATAHEITHVAASPSGRVIRYASSGLILDIDLLQRFWRLYRLPGYAPGAPAQFSSPVEKVVAARRDPWIGPLLHQPGVFVGGLISLSAEPPEGFFAASTSAELRQAGYALMPARQADLWIYRVPDSRTQSYFEFTYANPQRPEDEPRDGKFLLASGVGPASDPTSVGGREADALWLGDEQHGPLLDYLSLLSRSDLRLSHLTGQRGVIQKIPGHGVLLCQPNWSWGLTREGFNGLITDPDLYRQVYSRDYDEYLRGLFSPVAPAKTSYLLATSRGCTQGCSLCCSGGLKAFQSFSADRIMTELEAVARHSQLKPDEKVDIFFLDSNFNNAPERIIELANRLEASPWHKNFRFFVRHNTVKGFLHSGRPNLELIDAFRRLGIRDVFMGVDTFDDHSTLTLKSHRQQMLTKGVATRPTYTAVELAALVAALEASGANIKAFYLQNNPWVTDLDRLDSYYNLAELWLRYPHFSIDARYRDVNRLKPFAGSPIERVTRDRPELLDQGRYRSPGVLGELDEWMDMTVFGRPQAEGDWEHTLQVFAKDLERIRGAAASRYYRLHCAEAQRLLVKMRQRDQRFLALLSCRSGSVVEGLRQSLHRFERRWLSLPDVAPQEQVRLFEQASASLFEGLRLHLPRLVRPAIALRPSAAPVHLAGYRTSRPKAQARPLEMRWIS